MGSSQSDLKPQRDSSGTHSKTCKCGTTLTDTSMSSCPSCAELKQKKQQQMKQLDNDDNCYVHTDNDLGTSNLSPCTDVWDCKECVNVSSDDNSMKNLC